MLDVAIIGAGPYGLSIAAHAKAAGLTYKVFGYPMDFWKAKMPPEMFIRTQLKYTGLSDPDNRFTLEQYQNEKNIKLSYPISRSIFVDYGLWFIEKTNIIVEKVLIEEVVLNGDYFIVKPENGPCEKAKKVVVAVGLTNAEYIPWNLASLPKEVISHTSDYTQYGQFERKHVLVLGGGQSAWEAAALLHKAKAQVDLVYRRPHRLPPIEGINANQREIADKFYYYTDKKKSEIRNWLESPTVSDFLVPLVEGKVKQRPGTFIIKAEETKDGKVNVTFNNGTAITVDHIIAATGYRFSPSKLNFLQELVGKIELNDKGEPKVNEYFESTLKNLFFAGPATGFDHGPTFRVMAGVWRTSEVVIDYIGKNNRKDFNSVT
ncbi:NAD(P)-binding domain-containing protein [Neobacillus mesonae]|uniref:NAD(P)-binding domain-containing protein n=1 Tax=Neobacillus mesonae TaxID=1193713 RepID=UPI00203FB47A|nr:NAD(P)-binding domain-containing protein [Neobacillus mesonae]MCM3567597.1 NAD(P)-binding domain-containing protein [Neobacillus mesonae]